MFMNPYWCVPWVTQKEERDGERQEVRAREHMRGREGEEERERAYKIHRGEERGRRSE